MQLQRWQCIKHMQEMPYSIKISIALQSVWIHNVYHSIGLMILGKVGKPLQYLDGQLLSSSYIKLVNVNVQRKSPKYLTATTSIKTLLQMSCKPCRCSAS